MADPQTLPSQIETKRVFLETFGCQMNKLDSELVLQELNADGFVLTDTMREADLIVFNTCSVRDHAEQRVRSRLGRLKFKKNRKENSVVAVMGCMAQREEEDLLKTSPSVDLVVGTKSFLDLPQLYRQARHAHERKVAAAMAHEFRYTRDVRYRTERHRAYVSIMRGCDLRCTYCIVPKTRGIEESRSLADIRQEVERLVDDGVREVTLLGQTVNSWGKQLEPRQDLGDLLRALNEIDGLWRIRFITSHPVFFRNRFWDRIRDLKKVCRYIHVPAQHGSDRMLERMRRLYTRAEYLEMVAEARQAMPDIALASDFIVGFPGETEEEYLTCETMIREVDFQGSFVFKYSPRPGTPASELPDDVVKADKDRRCNALLAVQEQVARERNQTMIGKDLEVLVDGPSKTNAARLSGRSDDNRIVIFDGSENLIGGLVKVRIDRASAFSLYGELSEKVEAGYGPTPWRARSLPLVP